MKLTLLDGKQQPLPGMVQELPDDWDDKILFPLANRELGYAEYVLIEKNGERLPIPLDYAYPINSCFSVVLGPLNTELLSIA